MAGVNKVILIGNLGKDPEVRTIEGGAKVASFSIATSEVFKNKDGSKNETTEWHNIVLWRGLAELAEKYLTKGNQVYIEGRIKTRQWEDKDGIKRYTTEIIGDNLTFLGGGKSNQNAGDAPAKESNSDNSPEPIQEADDDLPF
jgi:single-strand DNA-binding protein